MHAEKRLIVYLQSQQLPVAGGNFRKKTTVSEEKLCSIVVNAREEVSEVRQAWLFNSVTLISC